MVCFGRLIAWPWLILEFDFDSRRGSCNGDPLQQRRRPNATSVHRRVGTPSPRSETALRWDSAAIEAAAPWATLRVAESMSADRTPRLGSSTIASQRRAGVQQHHPSRMIESERISSCPTLGASLFLSRTSRQRSCCVCVMDDRRVTRGAADDDAAVRLRVGARE